MYATRMDDFRLRLHEADFDIALITDEDNIYYLTGYYDYLHMDFGRPTILIVPRDSRTVLVTPSMEMDMAEATAHVDRVAAWNDGLGDEWRTELPQAISGLGSIGIEMDCIPQIVKNYIDEIINTSQLGDITPSLADMRMVKSSEELQLARHAGTVAMAMMNAARETIGDSVPEYEVALASSRAGTSGRQFYRY